MKFSKKRIAASLLIGVIFVALVPVLKVLFERAQISATGARCCSTRCVDIESVYEEAVDANRVLDVESIIEKVAKIPRIESLYMRGVPYTNKQVALITQLVHLQLLDLSNTSLDGDGLKLISQLSSLQELNITGCRRIKEIDLQPLRNLVNLKTLSLHGMSVTDASIDLLAALPNLTHIDIQGTEITNGGIDRLRRTKPNLEIRK